ncbi:MAG TPA: hypothetical protein PLD20_12740 [Blastocatellia bacterium]|nr:hypothetical protein [Blastocatellia bacterium]HMX28208.1 hypothetical protein [Blastocatellia bacterium]HMZ18794.1 hypothetical protein [Blastocatellia bacterium]HNG29839.1 hypothetical protein [Blastocatellia bacterium]
MCDYSLHNVPNRLAVEGEPLQVHKFPTGSLGLASPCDVRASYGMSQRAKWWQGIMNLFRETPPVSAVCIPPGAHLVLREIPSSLQEKLNIAAEEEVVFTQLSLESHRYRDGVQFQNGREILLQQLPVGLQFDVLSLSASEVEMPQPAVERPFRLIESHSAG